MKNITLKEIEYIASSPKVKINKTKVSAKKKSEKEELILYNLQSACSLDELSLRTKIEFECLRDKLFEMELDGKIRQNFAGLWERI